jgi:hypothetical protein
MLFKTHRSRIPKLSLFDVPMQQQQATAAAASAVAAAPKLLMKKKDGMPSGIGIATRSDKNGADQGQKTVQVSS